ncbi:MAG: VWA domain-containing protein [Akkermansiaceae bacterium]|nr:VWA domain-containing protein [Akkermansiaceae bacterium]
MNASLESTSLHFGQPLWLAVGAVICLTIVLMHRHFDRKRESDLAKLVHQRFRQQLFAGYSPRLRSAKRWLWFTAVACLFITLARPQMGSEMREVTRRGIDILFALDTSHSMLAEDLKPSRLERARLGILDFVDRLDGDRVGLIPFAGSAYALCPLTLDYHAFRESLGAVNTSMIPHQGTDLASAITEAERLFNENENNQRILVLITDGEDLQGDALDAARKAAKNGMVIYTVGVGSPEGTTIPVQYRNGRRDQLRDAKGNIVHTTLDETTLKKIAEVSKALYVPLGRGAEGLDTIYQEKLRLMPKTDLNQRLERIPLERFEWTLGFALLLLVLEFFLPDRKRVIVKPGALPSGTAVIGLALFVAMADGARAETDNRILYNDGTEAYQRGDFETAAETLRAALKTPDTTIQQRAYYNLGNSLYRVGQESLGKDPKETIKHWEEALKAYQDALALDPSDADARYNEQLLKKKLEELKQQQPEEDQDKQDQDKQDQDKQDQDKQDQDKQDQDKQDQDKQDQDKQDQDKQDQDKQDQDKQDQDKQDQDKQDQDKQDQDKQDQDKQDQDKQDQDKQDQDKQDQDKQDPDQQGEPQDAKENPSEQKDGETAQQQARQMTEEEAKQLLESLRHEERTVIPIPQRQRNGKTDNTTRGKTW